MNTKSPIFSDISVLQKQLFYARYVLVLYSDQLKKSAFKPVNNTIMYRKPIVLCK